MIIKHYIFRLCEIVLQKIHMTLVFTTKYGVKNINIGRLAQFDDPVVLEYVTLDPSALFLGADYLKDNYTLLDCNILYSPHYRFMKALRNNDNLYTTDYVERWEKGTLDWRFAQQVGPCIEGWKTKYNERYSEVINNTYSPILVCNFNKKYYIYDGKHRAALCSLLNKPIRCAVISTDCMFGFFNRYLLDITAHKKGYSKHEQLYKHYFGV